MDLKTIVALEIGSSKIKGAIGSVAPDNSLSVLAVEEVPSANNVRYGRIQNIREVARLVSEVIRSLESARTVQGRRVEGLAIALGGRSLGAHATESVIHFPQECEITEQQVARLKQEATRDYVSDTHIIEAVMPRKFYVNKTAVPRAVGSYGETLRGEFMLITCGKETHQNLERLRLDTVPAEEIRYALRPIAVADFVLTRDEKQVGAALIDVGAETTTVVTYKNGTLASLVTIPMGSALITRDLSVGLGITEEAAENIKKSLINLDPEDKNDRTPNIKEIKGYARARAGEIIANAMHHINLSITPLNALSTIVLTGGGSQLADFAKLVGQQSKIHVRMATMPEGITFHTPGRNTSDNIDIIALLAIANRIPGLKGLSPIRPVEPEEPVVVITPEAKPAPKAPAPAQEAPKAPAQEAPKAAPTQEPTRQAAPAASAPATVRKPVRKAVEEDDDRLLEDDPDDREPKSKSRSFFDIFRRKRKQRDEDEEDYDDDDSEEDLNINDIAYAEEEDDIQAASSRMDKFSDMLTRMLGPEEDNRK